MSVAVAYLVLVRSVRVLGSAVAVLFLTGCVTVQPYDVPAVGFVWLVSREDLRSAIAADQAMPILRPGKVDYVRVLDSKSIDIYFVNGGEDHDFVRKVQGKWRYVGGVIVGS